MKSSILLLTFTIILLAGCTKEKGSVRKKVNGEIIKNLVIRSLNNDTVANDSLSHLIDFKTPTNITYNELLIDSIESKSGKIFYSVLVQYPNPVYNRFAVYDSMLNNYLIDKSLNGNITEETITEGNSIFIKISEQFLSKDIFKLHRLSLYLVSDTTVNLVFRTYVSFNYDQHEYKQAIVEITGQEIKTRIESKRYSPINKKTDIFTLDQISGKYESLENYFDKYVVGKINQSNVQVTMQEITDTNSKKKSGQ